jgi:hypothetical protein
LFNPTQEFTFDDISRRAKLVRRTARTEINALERAEVIKKKMLDVKIAHRFNSLGTSSNGTSSVHNLWGFDESSDIRISFDYGLNNNWNVGFARSKYLENWELNSKYKLASQRRDNSMPFTATLFAVTAYSIFLKDWNYLGKEQKGFEMILEGNNLVLFVIGNLVAFVVAIIAIKFFIEILKKFGFKIWGWYRIILGLVFLIYFSVF